MKTDGGAITVFQLMISFLLVAITASGVVAGQEEAVLDNRGNPVKANALYYIFGPSSIMAITDKSLLYSTTISCPLSVLMTRTRVTVEPVMFELSSDVVRVSTELNIKFARPSLCPGSRYWKVGDSSKAVVLNGSKSSNDSTFTIKKFRGVYAFAFGNIDIGIRRGRHDYRLELSNNFAIAVSFAPA